VTYSLEFYNDDLAPGQCDHGVVAEAAGRPCVSENLERRRILDPQVSPSACLADELEIPAGLGKIMWTIVAQRCASSQRAMRPAKLNCRRILAVPIPRLTFDVRRDARPQIEQVPWSCVKGSTPEVGSKLGTALAE
jgi:hypothetical protein